MSDEVTTETVEAETGTSEQVESQEDKPLGENGEKALKAEREARKAAEARLAELEAKEKAAAMAHLSEVERFKAEAQEATAAREKAESELSVYKLAAKHGITDESDLSLLSAVPDEAGRERLAARIASSGDALTPKPDLTQGAKGSVNGGTTADQFAAFISDQLT